VGGIPYLLEHNRDALLAPANDADALAAAVRQILIDKSLSASLTQNARAKAEQFDWPAILPQWERLLTDAANKTAGVAGDE
jgi:glycosyltransferase involved in cell wall biosynthesis